MLSSEFYLVFAFINVRRSTAYRESSACICAQLPVEFYFPQRQLFLHLTKPASHSSTQSIIVICTCLTGVPCQSAVSRTSRDPSHDPAAVEENNRISEREVKQSLGKKR
jgi:hypothetical protein